MVKIKFLYHLCSISDNAIAHFLRYGNTVVLFYLTQQNAPCYYHKTLPKVLGNTVIFLKYLTMLRKHLSELNHVFTVKIMKKLYSTM